MSGGRAWYGRRCTEDGVECVHARFLVTHSSLLNPCTLSRQPASTDLPHFRLQARVQAITVLPGSTGNTVAFAYGYVTRFTIDIFDMGTRTVVAGLGGHKANVVGMTLLKGGLLVSASEDGTARLWDVAARQCVVEIDLRCQARMIVGLGENHYAIRDTRGYLSIFSETSLKPEQRIREHKGMLKDQHYEQLPSSSIAAVDEGHLMTTTEGAGRPFAIWHPRVFRLRPSDLSECDEACGATAAAANDAPAAAAAMPTPTDALPASAGASSLTGDTAVAPLGTTTRGAATGGRGGSAAASRPTREPPAAPATTETGPSAEGSRSQGPKHPAWKL